jgi:hypothetical protein
MTQLRSILWGKGGPVELYYFAEGSGREEERLEALGELVGQGELVAGVLGCQHHHVTQMDLFERKGVVVVAQCEDTFQENADRTAFIQQIEVIDQ